MALEDDIALLSSVPLLETFEREALRLLAFSADTRRLGRGETLYHKGEPSDGGYVVVSGLLRLDDGHGASMEVGSGALLGERTLIAELPRHETATALGETVVIRLSRSLFRRTLDEYPEAASRIADRFRERIATMSSELAAVRTRLDGIR